MGIEEFPDLESYIRVALEAFLNSRLLPKMAAPTLWGLYDNDNDNDDEGLHNDYFSNWRIKFTGLVHHSLEIRYWERRICFCSMIIFFLVTTWSLHVQVYTIYFALFLCSFSERWRWSGSSKMFWTAHPACRPSLPQRPERWCSGADRGATHRLTSSPSARTTTSPSRTSSHRSTTSLVSL